MVSLGGPQFPDTLPLIDITESDESVGPIDCRELQWWFATPEVGCSSSSASYDLDTGALDYVRQVVSASPTSTDGEDAVELEIHERPCSEALSEETTFRFTCILRHDRASWLAVTTLTADGSTTTTTVADHDFESQWGGTGTRLLVDNGRFERLPDGSYHITSADGFGAGTYTVTVGSREFTCLRVLDLPNADENQEFGEAFVEPGGRTILYRQYRGRLFDPDWKQWRDAHPGAEIRVDGGLFLLRDCTGRAHVDLTDTALPAAASS